MKTVILIIVLVAFAALILLLLSFLLIVADKDKKDGLNRIIDRCYRFPLDDEFDDDMF